MPDEFDRYREALVVETTTVWTEAHEKIDWEEKQKLADALHAEPEKAEQLEYVRTHTGFCRRITVTDQDLERLR